MHFFLSRSFLLIATMGVAGTLWLAQSWCHRFRQSLADPPRLHVDPGTQLSVETDGPGGVTRRFRLSNRGGRRLILSRLNPDCQCLDSSPPIVIPPGETYILDLDISESEEAPVPTWRFLTNDPNRPRLTLTVDRPRPQT